MLYWMCGGPNRKNKIKNTNIKRAIRVSFNM